MKISLITLMMISLMLLQAWSMDQVSKQSIDNQDFVDEKYKFNSNLRDWHFNCISSPLSQRQCADRPS